MLQPGTGAPAPEAGSRPRGQPWFHRLGGPQDDIGTGLAVDGVGDISVVWLSTPREDEDREPVPGQRRGLTLAKYGPDGAERWTRDFSRMRVASPRVVAASSGYQHHGGARAGSAWDQEAFLRLLAP